MIDGCQVSGKSVDELLDMAKEAKKLGDEHIYKMAMNRHDRMIAAVDRVRKELLEKAKEPIPELNGYAS